ncbi:MAG: hypothetical protein WDZ67_01400 [Patescibacteria group bacterium]
MSLRRVLSVFSYFVGLGLLARLWPKRYQVVPYCPEDHHRGSIQLRHHPKVPCDVALWVAEWAQVLWDQLREDFPKETEEEFELHVIWDPHRGPGFKPMNKPRAEINMACFFIEITHPGFEFQERYLRGTLAEELHHIVRDRRFGSEPYTYRGEPDSDHLWLEELLHYSLHDFEFEALRFCVRATGDRAELLERVEEHRRRRGRTV